MIEWIRDKFASAITFFFVVAVILCTICGGISGYIIGKVLGDYNNNYGGIGCLIGLPIGLFLGIISGILAFGFFATIIHISESCDDMAYKLDRLYSSQNNLAQNVSAAVSNDKISSENTSLSNIWVCPKCGKKNPVLNIKCTNCGEEKTLVVKRENQILENGAWKCPCCGLSNPANGKRCYCGFKRD